jgi:hypothetical protein
VLNNSSISQATINEDTQYQKPYSPHVFKTCLQQENINFQATFEQWGLAPSTTW